MRQPAAKQGDQIVADDIHTVLVPAGAGEAPVQVVHRFNGTIVDIVSSNVKIMGSPAATVDSVATDKDHLKPPPGSRFPKPPANRGKVTKGSSSVFINKQPAARHGDVAETCGDPADTTVGTVVVTAGTVWIG